MTRPLPSQTRLHERFSYDPSTGELIWRHQPNASKTWNTCYAGKRAGSLSGIGKRLRAPYRYVSIDGVKFLEHRIIWKWMTDAEPTEIDHINQITTDNRWGNLRLATHLQNTQNRYGHRNRELPPGVARQTACNNYRATIGVNGKTIHLGSFLTIEEAHAAYLTAKKRYHQL
jgi:hypothetical protein